MRQVECQIAMFDGAMIPFADVVEKKDAGRSCRRFLIEPCGRIPRSGNGESHRIPSAVSGDQQQLLAYPRLQNASRMSCGGISPSWPGAVQCPLHPAPSGSRAGCGQLPFSSFVTGMKYGQANSIFSGLGNCWDWPL